MGNRADGRLEGVTQKAEAELKEEVAQLQGMQERAPVAWTAVGRSLEQRSIRQGWLDRRLSRGSSSRAAVLRIRLDLVLALVPQSVVEVCWARALGSAWREARRRRQLRRRSSRTARIRR